MTLLTPRHSHWQRARGLLLLALQVGILVGLNALAESIAPQLPLPLPANLVGMILLVALLLGGVVKERWLAQAADLFQLHMALFFVPIAVGLMAYGRLVQQHGVALLLILLISTAAGLAAAAWVAAWPSGPKPERELQP